MATGGGQAKTLEDEEEAQREMSFADRAVSVAEQN